MKALRTLVLVFGSVIVIGFLVTSVVWWFLSANQTVNDWRVTTTEWTDVRFEVEEAVRRTLVRDSTGWGWGETYDTTWFAMRVETGYTAHMTKYWADTVLDWRFTERASVYYPDSATAATVAQALNKWAGGGR